MSTVREHLSRERIVEAALELVDRDGLDALSMRRLGAALGVEGMALYHHIPSKAELLDALIERVFTELDLPEPGGMPWEEGFRRGAHAYRALLLRHPNLIPPIATQQLTNPGVLRPVGGVMALLRAEGYDAASAHLVLCAFVSYITGFALWEAGTAPYRADPAFASPATTMPVPPSADPYVVELIPQLATTSCDDAFEFGLTVLLRGLAALRGQPNGR